MKSRLWSILGVFMCMVSTFAFADVQVLAFEPTFVTAAQIDPTGHDPTEVMTQTNSNKVIDNISPSTYLAIMRMPNSATAYTTFSRVSTLPAKSETFSGSRFMPDVGVTAAM